MLIKNVQRVPSNTRTNYMTDVSVVLPHTKIIDKIYQIKEKQWFLDIKKSSKKIASCSDINIFIDLSFLDKQYQFAAALAIFKSTYKMTKYNSDKDHRRGQCLCFVNQEATVNIIKSLKQGNDIASEPANKLYPQMFCERVQKMFLTIDPEIKVSWYDEKQIVKKGLGLVQAVGVGAEMPPRFLKIEMVGQMTNDPIVLIGKGVIFDSGGYNLKPGNSMTQMKGDKTGGAIVVSIMHYFAKLGVKGRPTIIGIIPLVENMISHKAHKVGDVVTAYNGKTVELLNMDAEGRLILADALAYVSANIKNPKMVLDFATLTGWAQVLHCDTSFVFYTNNDNLSKEIETSGNSVGERSIRLPNWPEYKVYTKSQIADYKNVNFECGRTDGFMASMFLMNFIEKYVDKWAHFDVTHNVNGHNGHLVNAAATTIKMIQNMAFFKNN